MIKNITIYPHPTLPIFNAQGRLLTNCKLSAIFEVSIGLSRFARNKKINYLCRNSVKNFKSNT